MNRLLVGVNFVCKGLLVALLAESHLVICRVINHLDYAPSRKGKRLMLAIKLHFVAVPGVPIRTDHVVAVVCVCIVKVEVVPFYTVEVGNPDPDPRRQLLDLYFPLLDGARD